MTIKPAIERRLCVPATPTELSALLGLPVRNIRCHLYQLRAKGRVEQLDRAIPANHRPDGRGRKWERLWQRKYLQELV